LMVALHMVNNWLCVAYPDLCLPANRKVIILADGERTKVDLQ
jgi:hypothetical protein